MQFAYEAVNVAHVPRNIQTVVVSHPDWMSKELADALTAIFERHAVRIDGLKSGFRVGLEHGQKPGKSLAFKDFDITAKELTGCAISETLNAWVDGAAKAYSEAANADRGQLKLGLEIVFYELNATHSAAERCWQLAEVFPKDTGIISAMLSLEDGKKHNEALDDGATWVRPTFQFLRSDSTYNSEATRKLVAEFIKNGKPSTQGYAEPIVPGGVYVFSIDEHDPDPKATVDFVQHEVNSRGVNVVVLNPEVKDLLRQGGIIDFEQLKSLCVQAPTWGDAADPRHPASFPDTAAERQLQLDDLKLREARLSTDTGVLQSQYWNYMAELVESVKGLKGETTEWWYGGKTIRMPVNVVALLHAKLDELSIPSALDLRIQGWQPPHFPKVNDRTPSRIVVANL